VLAAIELELRRRDALALPPGLSPEQRAVVRAERIKRDRGPRSQYWARCRALRDRLCARMLPETFRRAMDAVVADKRRRGW
jgi:hypothetical protein